MLTTIGGHQVTIRWPDELPPSQSQHDQLQPGLIHILGIAITLSFTQEDIKRLKHLKNYDGKPALPITYSWEQIVKTFPLQRFKPHTTPTQAQLEQLSHYELVNTELLTYNPLTATYRAVWWTPYEAIKYDTTRLLDDIIPSLVPLDPLHSAIERIL